VSGSRGKTEVNASQNKETSLGFLSKSWGLICSELIHFINCKLIYFFINKCPRKCVIFIIVKWLVFLTDLLVFVAL
jgi:hypothetical protein